MSANLIVILLGWLMALAAFFAFIILLRSLHHKERMALIKSGINPHDLSQMPRSKRSRGMLRAGLIIAMIGLALTIGLYPVGFMLPAAFASVPFHIGPWLLPGLIPLGVGIALIVSYYLEHNTQLPEDKDKDKAREKITPIQDRLNRDRKEGER